MMRAHNVTRPAASTARATLALALLTLLLGGCALLQTPVYPDGGRHPELITELEGERQRARAEGATPEDVLQYVEHLAMSLHLDRFDSSYPFWRFEQAFREAAQLAEAARPKAAEPRTQARLMVAEAIIRRKLAEEVRDGTRMEHVNRSIELLTASLDVAPTFWGVLLTFEPEHRPKLAPERAVEICAAGVVDAGPQREDHVLRYYDACAGMNPSPSLAESLPWGAEPLIKKLDAAGAREANASLMRRAQAERREVAGDPRYQVAHEVTFESACDRPLELMLEDWDGATEQLTLEPEQKVKRTAVGGDIVWLFKPRSARFASFAVVRARTTAVSVGCDLIQVR